MTQWHCLTLMILNQMKQNLFQPPHHRLHRRPPLTERSSEQGSNKFGEVVPLLKINHIRLFKKIGMIFLSTLLCILLIFNAGFIDCFAVAGVDDAALLFLLAAICVSCGVIFATYESAEAGTSALYDNMDSGTRTILDGYVEKLEAELAVNTAGVYVGASFVADYWSDVLKAVVATFGTYEAINTVTNLSDPNFTGVTESTSFEYTLNCNESSVSQYQINNMTHTIIGYEATGFTVPSYVDVSAGQSTRRYTEYLSIANGIFDCFFIEYGGDTFDCTESIRYSDGRLAYGSTLHYFSDTLYFGGHKLVKELIDSGGGFALTADGVNIVQSGYIMGTDIPVSTGICPDGIWTEKNFSDWLNDLIFGNTLPGNPGIDAVSYPGNDVWHDGSINDDIAVGSPSIGIAVPATSPILVSVLE